VPFNCSSISWILPTCVASLLDPDYLCCLLTGSCLPVLPPYFKLSRLAFHYMCLRGTDSSWVANLIASGSPTTISAFNFTSSSWLPPTCCLLTGSCLPVLPPYFRISRLVSHYFYFPPPPPSTIVLTPPTSRASTPCTFLPLHHQRFHTK